MSTILSYFKYSGQSLVHRRGGGLAVITACWAKPRPANFLWAKYGYTLTRNPFSHRPLPLKIRVHTFWGNTNLRST